ncbi:MAG: peptidase U32 family protein [Fibrobacterota bacterium]
MEKLISAYEYGADAAYGSYKQFSLRANSRNFSIEEIKEAVSIASSMNKKFYLAVNSFIREYELDSLRAFLEQIAKFAPDALILSDTALIYLCRKIIPEVSLHLSTQANTMNSAAAGYWKNSGIKRIIAARELSLSEIKMLKRKDGPEVELFIHGAMCMAVSGRCLISDFFNHRSANRGDCSHPCRYSYGISGEDHQNTLILEEDPEKGTYIMNSRDLCTIDIIPDIIQTGADSLKIEGRMKSTHYLATAVKVYREAVDSFCRDPENYKPDPLWKEELLKVSVRSYTTGFYTGKKENRQTMDFSSKRPVWQPAAVVRQRLKDGHTLLEAKNRLSSGETVELFASEKGVSVKSFEMPEMRTVENETVETVHANTVFKTMIPCRASKGNLIRKKSVTK